jgi:8-amino-3,8-dideoxy-alpha-D-manno-octulosonate transaminase
VEKDCFVVHFLQERAMESNWPLEFPGVNWLDEAERRAVLDVVEKGSLFRYYGPDEPNHVQQLEAYARTYYGVKYALGVNSGTGALLTAMSALSIGPGCEVIVPAYMWVATINAIVRHNAIPVLCEVDDSFTMNPADLEKKITPRTRLIVPVHMSGAPSDMERIMEIANRCSIAVLEDCAQSNGGSFGGQKLGTLGAIGIYSFQINKNVTAGEGGLIVTNDEDLYLKALAAHDLGIPWKNAEPDATSSINLWGQGRRMSELCGAVANVQIRKLQQIVDHMRQSKQRIREALYDFGGLQLRRMNDPEGDTGPALVLILEDGERAKKVAANIKKKGFDAVWHLPDYGLHIYYNISSLVKKVPLSQAGNPWLLKENADSVYEYKKGACPRSDALFDRSVLVTIPSRLTQHQEEAMTNIIKRALG